MNRASLQSWLEAYRRAWEERDAEAAVELYSEDATYQETPFVPPMRGRNALLEYWKNVARTQDEIGVSCEVIAICEGLCFARWHATFTRLPTRTRLELDGIFLLTFDQLGKCTALREWWHRKQITGRA
jgi:limonene-1,2-epoxide hydrolase